MSSTDLLQSLLLLESPLWTVALASAVLALVSCYYALAHNRGPKKLLPLQDYVNVPLIRKQVVSHDVRRFTFGLPPNTTLGLHVGQHVALKFYEYETGKAVQRSYTPVSDSTAVGHFELVVKVYRPAPPKFPRGGLMSQHLDDLQIGEIVQLAGPRGHVRYEQGGRFTVKPLGRPVEHRSCDNLALMAGGTGITPMLQLLHCIFRHPTTAARQNSKLRVKLLYANQTPDDILVRPELQDLAERYPDRFQLWYTVDRRPPPPPPQNGGSGEEEDWKYSVGFIDKDMIQQHLLFPSSDGSSSAAGANTTQFFMCGPPPMIKFACLPALKELGFTEKDWVVY